MTESTNNLDQLASIHDTIRSHIEKTGSHYGYGLNDFDNVYASFDNEAAKEDFLQELYDNLPKEG